MPKAKEFKLPKSPAACADLLYTTREARLKMQKDVDKLQETETALKEYFIQSLPKNDATGIAGKIASVNISTSPVPQVEDWDKFYAFVKKTGAFQFLQRRVSETAVKDFWDNKKQVPGVGRFNAVKVSCTKI